MTDPIVLTLVGQALVTIGILVKMLRDAHTGETNDARRRRVDTSDVRIDTLEGEMRGVRERMHSQADVAQAAVLRVAVMEARMDSVDRSLTRVERLLEGLDRKIDGLAAREGGRE